MDKLPIDSIRYGELYSCECVILLNKNLKKLDTQNFELTGEQIKGLWRTLSLANSDWNLEFHFGYYPKQKALKILGYDKKYVNDYMKKVGLPEIFDKEI